MDRSTLNAVTLFTILLLKINLEISVEQLKANAYNSTIQTNQISVPKKTVKGRRYDRMG